LKFTISTVISPPKCSGVASERYRHITAFDVVQVSERSNLILDLIEYLGEEIATPPAAARNDIHKGYPDLRRGICSMIG